MTRSTTANGTQVLSPTREEYRAMVEREVRSAVGENPDTFAARYAAGTVDRSDPDVLYAAGILRLNGPAT